MRSAGVERSKIQYIDEFVEFLQREKKNKGRARKSQRGIEGNDVWHKQLNKIFFALSSQSNPLLDLNSYINLILIKRIAPLLSTSQHELQLKVKAISHGSEPTGESLLSHPTSDESKIPPSQHVVSVTVSFSFNNLSTHT